ncbi:flavin-containing monooxygenase [Polymorphobacter fuscus]|nr:NAD(P)/FAD-dependent oxidoreductase [Polymorphobacter fuscus]NJC08889.1 cation diffusion facilitator CzcD-associated flavoprotein CzcO [Polymorphobacter fuscus]
MINTAEHFDVVVVGAGISGLSAAWHFKNERPGTRFVVLEREASFGGTWLTHKFPGIRSDSDLYTFGFRFKPWVGPPIATAEEIRAYLGEMIAENDLSQYLRFGHTIETAEWSSETSTWTVTARLDSGETRTFTANFLYMAQGYFKHRQGYMPEWPGMADFKGPIVHTEEWDGSIDYAGKRVALIGSGATAATVIPAMANTAEMVTMVQRSPTYFFPAANANETADMLRALKVDEEWVHEITRRKINFDQDTVCRRCVEEPEAVKAELLEAVRSLLPEGFDMKHFTPSYRPWRQRLAFVPNGDMFEAIRDGKAGVVTGEIARFTENGLAMTDGTTVEADIVLAATGFNLCVMGDIAFRIDGKPLDWNDTVTWRGMMFTGVPNMVWVFGYLRASWTLRADMVSRFVCRLLDHMADRGASAVVPALRPEDHNMPLSSWIDTDDFNANYILRGQDKLPKRGDKREWQHTQDYWREKDEFPALDLDDRALVYSGAQAGSIAAE